MSRHDATRDHVLALLRYGKQGDPGVLPALKTLQRVFIETVGPDRPGGRDQATEEFRSFIYADRVAQLLAQPDRDDWINNLGEPPPDDPGGENSPPSPGGENSPPPDDDAAAFEYKVAERTYRLRVDAEARRRLDAEEQPPIDPPPIKRLDELLAEPDTEECYRIDKVAPADARIMLNAQWKAGKTTLVGNLARALVDDEPFLGRFTVNTPAHHVVIIDDELSENLVRRWLRDQNIANTTAVHVVTLRGKLAAFNLLDEKVRAEWADRLRALGCDYLALDCLRPILDALGLDERSDAGKFLVAYDALLTAAGINDSLIVQHMGHANERARGDSRLQDWPDAIWSLIRDEHDDEIRYFKAVGRDVSVPEGRLGYDRATRHLTYVAGSRNDAKTEAAKLGIIRWLADRAKQGEPSVSKNAIETEIAGTHPQKHIRLGLTAAVTEGYVAVDKGTSGAAHLHRIAYPCAKCGMPVITKAERHLSCPDGLEELPL